ncbi:MAG: hypothetical protein ACPF9H_08385 [Aequoribacter sp.]|jgi:hypothetical protein|uniref:hypothetical protein n=1 Tax=Aequoribacter sp. TaxID=2847771 RepID=UPI003C6A28A2
MQSTRKIKSDLLTHFRYLVTELYGSGDGFSTTTEWRQKDQHLQGYIDAIIVTGLIDAAELQSIIDEIHLDTFGESRLDRRRRLKSLEQGSAIDDWRSFETPAFERVRKGK